MTTTLPVLLSLVLAGAEPHPGQWNRKSDTIDYAIEGTALLIPDLRYERTDTAAWVLTWPVPYAFRYRNYGHWREDWSDLGETGWCYGYKWQVMPQVFLEPQLRLDDKHLRLVAGARSFVFQNPTGRKISRSYNRKRGRPHLLLEALAVYGTDGRGAGLGLGLGFKGAVSLAYRHLWTDLGRRQSITLDLHLLGFPSYSKKDRDRGVPSIRSRRRRAGWEPYARTYRKQIAYSRAERRKCFLHREPIGFPPEERGTEELRKPPPDTPESRPLSSEEHDSEPRPPEEPPSP